jgi:hypothetical protein
MQQQPQGWSPQEWTKAGGGPTGWEGWKTAVAFAVFLSVLSLAWAGCSLLARL